MSQRRSTATVRTNSKMSRNAKAPRKPFRVAIVDDHPMLCAGVADSFNGDPRFTVVALGASTEDAIEIAGGKLPDLMLIDINMPGDGLVAVREVVAKYPAIKVLVLTAYDDDYYLSRALRSGAHGYILKGIASSELIANSLDILDGGLTLPSRVLTDRLRTTAGDEEPIGDLTARESEIISLVARGLSNAEVAQELGLAESTVKNYMTSVLEKLKLRNRVEAAMFMEERRRRNSH